jgi:sialidase-1
MKSEDTRRVYVSSSNDNGKTWSCPKEITRTTKADNWTWYATGPGHGIQLQHGLHKGRLLIPCDHIEAKTKMYYSHVIYSDDNGRNWQIGGSTPQHQVNECMAAEIPDGRILLNMRNYDRSKKTRKISWSNDGGISWSDLQPDTALIEPICQASLFYTEQDESLWFLNPSSTTSRSNMTLKRSLDLGKSWEIHEVLYPGASAYSDLCQIETNKLGCLFEAGIASPYEGIVFTIVNTNKKKKKTN